MEQQQVTSSLSPFIFGLVPSAIPYALSPVPEGLGTKPHLTVQNPRERVLANPKVRKEIEDQWGDKPIELDLFQWNHEPNDNWHWMCQRDLAQEFSFEELVRLWFSLPVDCDVGRWVEKEHFFVWKMRHVQFQFGPYPQDLNDMVWLQNGLKNVKLPSGMKDFEVRITHTRAFNEQGSSEHSPTYLCLDAPLALVLFYKGEHVLTIGFGAADRSIFLAQVQLRSKRANRWLFKLPKNHLDFAIDLLRQAFNPEHFWIVDGVSTVKELHRFAAHFFACSEDTRIRAFYDQPLESFQRTDETSMKFRRTYVKLGPKA